MRQPGTIMVALGCDEDLGLVLESAKGRRMDDPIPIALEAGSRLAFGLGMEAAPALCRVAGVWHAQHDHCGTVSKPLRIAIGLTNARGIICKSRDSEDFGKPRHQIGRAHV